MARLLLEAGADIETKSKSSGMAALHEAADVGYKSTVQLLLQMGVDLVATCYFYGQTATRQGRLNQS
jgi:ankyrin repeat protein